MPCIDSISTKRPDGPTRFFGFGASVSTRVFIPAFISFFTLVIPPTAALGAESRLPATEPSLAVIRQALDRSFRMDYPGAEAAILEGLPASSPARPYYAGTICVNRFLDWGDTTALSRAERYWETLSAEDERADGKSSAFPGADPAELSLYRGLAGFQQSYVAALRGQHLRPATLTLAARRQLLPLKAPEARATLILYDYYRSRLLGKLPFVDAAEFPLAEFQRAADDSPTLRDMFQSSLFWILVENGKAGAALRIPEGFLERYPGNRLAREMRGSGLYRAGRLAEARTEYESLREEYRGLNAGLLQGLKKSPDRPALLPLGYYRAVGNLARIYAALGMRPEAEARLAEWNRAGLTGAGPWLPPSLKRDLAK